MIRRKTLNCMMRRILSKNRREKKKGIESAIVEKEIDKLATIRPIFVPITSQLARHIILQHAEIY